MLYGRSLSGCVYDILKGLVDIRKVGAIVASTRCGDSETWLQVKQSYARHIWSDFSMNQINCVIHELNSQGKIIQPRLIDDHVHQYYRERGKWTDSLVAAFATLRGPNVMGNKQCDYICQGCDRLGDNNICTDPYCNRYDDPLNQESRLQYKDYYEAA